MLAGLGLVAEAEPLRGYLEALFGRSFGVSVGINHGRAVIGEIGTGSRRSVTAISDAVNVAARVEWANRVHGTKVLISELGRVAAGPGIVTRSMPAIELPGKSGLHVLHEVTGISHG